MAIAYRTFSPKVLHYQPDGRGRDGYVAWDSGGLLHAALTHRGSSTPKTNAYLSPARVRMDAKALKYHSDGTGRDRYIL